MATADNDHIEFTRVQHGLILGRWHRGRGLRAHGLGAGTIGRIHRSNDSDSIAAMNCRPDCGACCTAPSITSTIPGMPHGKPAGVPCVQLDGHLRCRLFGRAERPAVCLSLRPTDEMCGSSRTQALAWLERLERHTAPASPAS